MYNYFVFNLIVNCYDNCMLIRLYWNFYNVFVFILENNLKYIL